MISLLFAGILFFMGYVKIDITGQRFGRWFVLGEYGKNKYGKWQFKCKCDCGTEKVVDGNRLRSGGSMSCGCLNREAISKSNGTHGLSKLPLYSVWNNIRKRCYDKKIRQYKDYGGRGIKMHEPWINDPPGFIKWCMDNGWRKGLQVDRENNDGDYVPNNIRFITHKEQQRNTRKNVFYTHDGQTKCLAEWAEITGRNYATVCVRIKRGWTIHDALFGEPKKDNRKYRPSNVYYTYKGETKILLDWAQQFNIKYDKLQARLKKLKWPIEKALTMP